MNRQENNRRLIAGLLLATYGLTSLSQVACAEFQQAPSCCQPPKDASREFHADGPVTFFGKLLDTSDYPARWYCGTWTLETGWLHVISDAAIFGAYFSIPCAIVYFMYRRRDFPYLKLIGLFAAFILACGIGHLIEACIFWWPAYRLSGVVKAITAIISWATVVVGLRIIPQLLELPGIARLNAELTEQRNLLDTIINDCTLPIFWKNVNCEVVGCNQAFVELIGMSSVEEVVKQGRIAQLGIPEECVERYKQDDRQVLKSGEPMIGYEETVELASGTRLLKTSKVPRFAADGSICGLIGFCEDITDRRLARAELEEAHRLFRGTFEQAAVGIAHCDAAGNWLLANQVMCDITGFTEEELLATTFQSITHPDDLEEDLNYLEAFLAAEMAQGTWEKRFVRKDGSCITVRLTMSATRCNGELERFIVVVEDTTEEVESRRREAVSLQEIAKLSLVAANIQHSVVIANKDGEIEWVNDAFVKMTGFTMGEVVGRKPGAFLQGQKTDQETVARIRSAIARREPIAVEIVNYHKDGKDYWIRLEISPVFDDAGNLSNFISTQADITDRKRQQDALVSATEAAEAANVAKSEFLANMSHEIRTPLNGILGFTELLIEDDSDAAERHDHLHTIHTSGRHLLELINSVLDLSKIEAGQLTVELLACSPHAVLAEVVSILRVRASEKGIALDYSWEGPIPQSIETDPHRFKQVLMNLVGNAIKFTKQGYVHIVASVDCSDKSPALKVEIRDTGDGIAADRLESIFEPFVQADSSVTRQFGGTGLGLPISRRIATALGGSVDCASVVGVGSCFTLRIATGDLKNVEMLKTAPEAVSGDITGSEQSAVSLEGLNVLVVDDGSTNRKLIRLILTRVGALVETAENGQVAIEKVTSEDFDLVLMDMQMPVLDGYEATRRLRTQGYRKPIIALTANALKGDQGRCLEAGCSGYLSKPIDMGSLTHALANTQVCKLKTPEDKQSDSASSELLAEDSDGLESPVEYECSLPLDDPAIREIVEEFLGKLDPQFELMRECLADGNLEELTRLAHWLKGAGGTVGFDCFTEPAAELERQAKSGGSGLDDMIAALEQIANAISLDRSTSTIIPDEK